MNPHDLTDRQWRTLMGLVTSHELGTHRVPGMISRGPTRALVFMGLVRRRGDGCYEPTEAGIALVASVTDE
jgi:hypothetical protein